MSNNEKPQEEEEKKEFGKFDRWDIEHAVNILIEAEQIKLDKEKMKYVLPILEKQKQALDKVATAAEILYGKTTNLKENQ